MYFFYDEMKDDEWRIWRSLNVYDNKMGDV